MSAIAAITVADGKATPLNHVFYPIESGKSSLYRTAIASLPLTGQEVLQNTIRELNANISMVTLILGLPALETATGANSAGYTAAPKVAYSNKVKVEFFLPVRGTPAQRTDLRVLLRNLLADPQVVDAVDNLISAY